MESAIRQLLNLILPKMSPPELLRETERAAGNTRLAEWHNQLIELRDEEKKFETVGHHTVDVCSHVSPTLGVVVSDRRKEAS